MNISGFELQHTANSTFCRNAYCSAVIPICFAGVSPTCSRNRSFTGWRHFSFGEHVCQECIYFLSYTNAKTKINTTHSIWRYRISSSQRTWMRRSSHLGRRRVITVEEFVAGNLLPWWMQCIRCGCWRQVTAHTPVGSRDSPFRPDQFTCSLVSQLSENACSWPVDDRSVVVHNRPQDFLASMQIHAWLQGSPTLNLLAPYGVDVSGLSPDSLPGASEEEKPSNDQGTSDSTLKIVDEQGPFSLVDLRAWERLVFPEMTRFPTLYLAVRNLVLYLWAKDPRHLLTSKFVANHCFVRGLLRIVLCDHWIPHLVEEFTYRGLINVGACNRDTNGCGPILTNPTPRESSNGMHFATAPAKPKATPELRISVLGGLDLTNAVAARQILNGLLVRTQLVSVNSEPLESSNRHFSLNFQPIGPAHCPISSDFSGALKELCIKFSVDTARNGTSEARHSVAHQCNSPHRKLIDTDTPNPSAECHHVTIGGSEIANANAFPDRLMLPMHLWSDRIYTHPNHPLRFMVMQADLPLRPLNKCVLLYPTTNGSTTSLEVVSKEVSLRMEFHVEAVLDLVAEFGEQQMKSDLMDTDEVICQSSVQDCWDRQDAEVRKRLTDLTRSDLEHRLIEFYLAEVEYDLTETLVTNNPYNFLGRQGSGRFDSWPCPTARLDCLPSHRYAEFTLDESDEAGSGMEKDDFVNSGHPHLLAPSEPSQGPVSTLCAPLLSGLFRQAEEVHRITVNQDLLQSVDGSDGTGETDRFACLASTPRVDHPNELWTKDTKTNRDLLTLRSMKGELESTDWVVLTCPLECLRLNFYETPCQTELFSSQMPNSLVIDIPISLRSSLVHEGWESALSDTQQSGPVSEQLHTAVPHETPACLITVTLIYSTAWWRPGLLALAGTDAVTNTSTESKGTSADDTATISSPLEWFAILPEDRENRGFCHTFRDVYPHLDQPGVLQTQLFGAAADHWWSKGDALLTANVHHFLKSRWTICDGDGTDSAGTNCTPSVSVPIFSHVARMQHSPKNSNVRNTHSLTGSRLSVLDCHGQMIHLRPNAWEELARQTHLLIPALFPPSTAQLTEAKETIGFCGLPENVQLTRSPGMDVLTSTVLDGLHIANLVLRCIPGLGSRSILNYPSFQSKQDCSLQDSSTLLSDGSQPDESSQLTPGRSKISSKASESATLSARAKRLLRRTNNPDEYENLVEAF